MMAYQSCSKGKFGFKDRFGNSIDLVCLFNFAIGSKQKRYWRDPPIPRIVLTCYHHIMIIATIFLSGKEYIRSTRPNTILVHTWPPLQATQLRSGSENSEATTLRRVRIVFDVVKQYTIVSTKLRNAAILYDNVASPKKGHNEGKSETGTVPKECIDINSARGN